MLHVADLYAGSGRAVHMLPGDWWGFKKGMFRERVRFSVDGADLACLCLPSVRHGQVTADMVEMVARARASLWNLNLWPTVEDDDRVAAAAVLAPHLPRALLSISFSRGFAMTTSQLGLSLVPDGHPLLAHREALSWLTYFHHAIAARTFCSVDVDALRAVDRTRRAEVDAWLCAHELPVVHGGTYCVKSFRPSGALPERLRPLLRDDDGEPVVRLCFKPTAT